MAGALLMTYAILTGLPVLDALRATVAVLLVQVLPGVLVWRSVRPRAGWVVEDLGMGFAIGSVLAIGAQIVAGLSESPLLAFSPLVVAIVLIAVPVTRARIASARVQPLPWWWGPAVAGFIVMTISQLRGYFQSVPLTWASGSRSPHVDAYLHLALAGQLAHRGPTTFPWVRSEALGYHWFSHAWVAQVSLTSGVGLDAALFRFMPAVMPVAVVVSIAAAAVRLSGLAWTGPIAAGVGVFGGHLNVFGAYSYSSPIEPYSPSLSLSAPMLVGLVVVLVLRWNRAMLTGGVALVVLLALGAAGTKGSTLPLIVTGLGLALLVMLVIDRRRVWLVVSDLIIVVGALLVAVVFVFRGSDAGLHVSLADAADQTELAGLLGHPTTVYAQVLAVTLASAGVLARGAGAFALPFSRTQRRNPQTWLLIGACLAGAGAVAVFAHPGVSQRYFARNAEPLMGLGSALGLAVLSYALPRASWTRVLVTGTVGGVVMVSLGYLMVGPLRPDGWTRAVVMIVIAGFVLALTAVVATLGAMSDQRWRLAGATAVMTILAGSVAISYVALLRPPAGPIGVSPDVSVERTLATSRDQVDAARWIRDHSGINDLVMTNRHCATPVAPVNCDSRRFVVTAFSERQVLLEGWTATPMSARLAPHGRDSITVNYWDPQLLQLNDGFVAAPSQMAATQLRELGVRWIYVDHTRPYAPTLEPYATLRYHNPGVDVYEFEAPQ